MRAYQRRTQAAAALIASTYSSGTDTQRAERRIKTQTVLPVAETAAMMVWADAWPSGRITRRKVNGWKAIAEKPSDQPIDLAA